MPVHVWFAGRKADSPTEVLALRELVQQLRDRTESYYVFWNFYIPGRQIDFLVIAHNAIFCVELKSTSGLPVTGTMNGEWKRLDGSPLGRPVSQILSTTNELRSWLSKNTAQVFSANEVSALRSREVSVRSILVLYPKKHPDSRIDIGGEWRLRPPHGAVVGFDKLCATLDDAAYRGRSGVAIELRHVESLAGLLGLERLTDLHTLEPTDSMTATQATERLRGFGEPTQARLWQRRVSRTGFMILAAACVLFVAWTLIVRFGGGGSSDRSLSSPSGAFYEEPGQQPRPAGQGIDRPNTGSNDQGNDDGFVSSRQPPKESGSADQRARSTGDGAVRSETGSSDGVGSPSPAPPSPASAGSETEAGEKSRLSSAEKRTAEEGKTPVLAVRKVTKGDIGRVVTVRMTVADVSVRGDSVYLFTREVSRGSFSVEIIAHNDVELARSELMKFKGEVVLIGPAKLKTDSNGDPQIEFYSLEYALSRIRPAK